MSFLDKFKGRTHVITKDDTSGILGRASSQTHNSKPKNSIMKFQILQPKNNQIQTRLNNKQVSKGGEQKKSSKTKVNPYYVANPFYIDQKERQQEQKVKREKEIKERAERQKAMRVLLEAKMAQNEKLNRQKYNNKDWIHYGGLGPDIGGQEWTRKHQMHSKMMKFAQQIQQENNEKLKCSPNLSNSSITRSQKNDSRTRALEYSRTIPRPVLMAGESIVRGFPRSETRESINELQMLDKIHQKYMNLAKKI